MGKKRAAAGDSAAVLHRSDQPRDSTKKQKQQRPPVESKKQRKQVHHLIEQFKLSEEQQTRLGSLCSTTQWLLRVAQGRGETACLAIREIITSTISNDEWFLVVESADRQMVPVTMKGDWVKDAELSFYRAAERIRDHPFIISGSGADLTSNDGRITYCDGLLLVHIIDLGRLDIETDMWLQHGWFEVRGGKVTSRPERNLIVGQCSQQGQAVRTGMPILAPTKSQEAALFSSGPILEEAQTIDLSDAHPVQTRAGASLPQVEKTPAPTRSVSKSCTPDWLKTPASIRRVTSAPVVQTPTPQRSTLPRASRTPDSHSEERAQRKRFVEDRRAASRLRELGQREITPVQELREDNSKRFNAIGVIVSREEARRCNGGDFDLTVKVALQDLYPPPNGTSRPLTFMLFGPDESWLPVRSKPGDLICFASFAMKSYCGARQAVGASRKFEWILCDRQSGAICNSIGTDDTSDFYQAVAQDILKHRKHLCKDSGANSVDDTAVRRLTEIRHVESSRFFDCDVEVLGMWDAFNPTVFVTDYTSHPKLHCTRDTELGVLSREELDRQRDATGEKGFGHVLPVTFWDEQRAVISQIAVGMRLRLINVRPKISPGGFLEGNMGSGGLTIATEDARQRVFLLDDADAAHITKKRTEYEKKIELMRKHAQDAQSEEDVDKENQTRVHYSAGSGCDRLRRSSILPFRRKKSISAHDENVTAQHDAEMSVSLGQASISVQAKELQSPSVVELLDAGAELPLINLNDVVGLQTDPLHCGTEYRCRVRVVADVVPNTIRDFVMTRCAGCERRLPPDHAICVRCSEMDHKDLRCTFQVNLLVGDASDSDGSLRDHNAGDPPAHHPIQLSGDEALVFFHHIHPSDVQSKEKTQIRLARRLAPIVGVHRAFNLLHNRCDSGSERDDDMECFKRFCERVPHPPDALPQAFEVILRMEQEFDGEECRTILKITSSRLRSSTS